MRLWIALVLGILASLLPCTAFAGPGDKEAYAGMNAAKGGFCKRAIPLLEAAESKRHRPSSALALADCYAKGGDLIAASKLYQAIGNDKKEPGYNPRDMAAIPAAKRKAAQIEARIPTVAVVPEEPYERFEVEIGGVVVDEPTEPYPVNPRARITVVARAEGYEERSESVTLKEKEKRILKLRLKPKSGAKPPPQEKARPVPAPKTEPESRPEPEPAPAPENASDEKGSDEEQDEPASAPGGSLAAQNTWLGVGYQGFFIPKFLFGIFGEGGRNVIVPGGEVAVTTKAGRFDLVLSLAYASFALGETPFKPNGHPDTDYEIIESTLQALQANARLVLDFPLDERERFSFRLGAGIGVGWTFLGDLYRTQAYPPNLRPSDPYTYLKCRGPNNPSGSFRYCNQLDYDADHYPGYVEPDWFTRPKGKPTTGVRPLIYPWLLLPELGIAYRPSEGVAIDLKVGASVTGLLTGLGVRFAL